VSRDPRADAGKLEELARAWTAADAAELAASAPAGDAEKVWQVAAGEASGEEVRRVALEAANDPATALALRLARELGAGAEADAAALAAAGPAPAARPSWRFWPAAAAVVMVLAAVVGLRWLAPGPTPEPAWRTGEAAAPLIDASEEGARKPRRDFTLRWRGDLLPGARYTVRVTTSDLTPVHEADDLEVPETTVPESALAALAAGTTLYWQVEARMPDGRLLTSRTVSVVLVDEPRGPGESPRAREGGTR